MVDRKKVLALAHVVLFYVGALSVASVQGANSELSQELKQRGLVDGLALVRTSAGNQWEVVPLNGAPRTIGNPRGLSGAWFAGNGAKVAWSISSWPGEEFSECPSPVIVEDADGTRLWQLPGNVINSAALAVTVDGRRVAFDGTYKPNGTGFLNSARNRQRWVTGLQLADIGTKSVSRIMPLKDSFDGTVPEHIGWISWAPDGNYFVYDFRGQIYTYDISSKTRWHRARIRFGRRTANGLALIAGRKILWGIHWSPDSTYVMFAEPRPARDPLQSASTQLVIYRLRDGASTPIYGFGYMGLNSDHGFFWVKDSQTFLKNAAVPPPILPCEEP